MLAGSTVVADWHGVGKADSTIKAYESYRAQHLKLIAENGTGLVAKDIVFGSPSTAGAIAQGRSCNGRISWIAQDGTRSAPGRAVASRHSLLIWRASNISPCACRGGTDRGTSSSAMTRPGTRPALSSPRSATS